MSTTLGATLLETGLITEAHLAKALAIQKRSGSRLGDILIAEGIIGYRPLYRAVAGHYKLSYVDLLESPPDKTLLNSTDALTYLRLRVLPWKKEGNITVMAVSDVSDDALAWIRKAFGADIRLVMTSPFDIRRTVEKHFGNAIETSSRDRLWRKLPQASAKVLVPLRQKQVLWGLLLFSLCALSIHPVKGALAAIILCHIAYAASMLFKCTVFAAGAYPPAAPQWKRLLERLDERSLPVYTVLIPMYREAASVPPMLEAMRQMDYPAAKLDIKLVLEEDDEETLLAALRHKPSYNFDIIRVPPAEPRTKPRACNYALRFARGEFITVFDADDQPDRLQLKKAVCMFRALPKDVACLQARLNYYNASDNWLTRVFSLEYAMLFQFLLPGLQRLNIPLPLGGTSNHIALARLRQLGDWDPYNVTEDADLGTRLAAQGLRTVMLDSFTMEEAPNAVVPWIRQRSRWIKGYMQTWLVHMRSPAQLYRTLGWRGFMGFQFFVGLSCFTFLTAPLVWLLSFLWVGSLAHWHAIPFPGWLAALTLANLLLNLATHWYLALYCSLLYRKYTASMIAAALTFPAYLLLHSLASYKALWQLFVKPYFWEKTTHGLAKKPASAISGTDLLKMPVLARAV